MTVSKISQPVLFVCTGNYYRSRIAEILFNHLAREKRLPLKAFSRGLRLNPSKNTGVISPHAEPFLASLNIVSQPVGKALPLSVEDLHRASRVVLMDETEHRPMLRSQFPEWENNVEYWRLEDDYLASPEVVLPQLHERVRSLVTALATTN